MKVYFAHPCFTDRQLSFNKLFLQQIAIALDRFRPGHNTAFVDPFAHTPNIEGDIEIKLRMADQIKSQCLQLLDECDVIVALADGADTGTAFETGYAYAKYKPVILISESTCIGANAMLIGAATTMIDNVLREDGMKKLALALNHLEAKSLV